MLKPKVNAPTTISYYLISERDGYSYIDYLMGPQSFKTGVAKFLDFAPVDLFQIINPQLYFNFRANNIQDGHLTLGIIYSDNFHSHLHLIQSRGIIVIILGQLDKSEKNDVTKLLNTIPIELCYLYDIENPSDVVLENDSKIKVINNLIELVNDLTENAGRIIESLCLSYPSIQDKLKNYLREFKEYPKVNDIIKDIPLFKAAHSNFFTWCQITGNYWINNGNIDPSTSELLASLSEKAAVANKEDPDARYRLILEEISTVDYPWARAQMFDPESFFEPTMQSMILCFPFQNPQSEKLADYFSIELPPQLNSWLSIEQNFNYVFLNQPPINKFKATQEGIAAIVELVLVPRISYLDFVMYLHASFNFSPIYRFPLTGSSLNTYLSFLKPNTRNNLHAHNLNKTISRLSSHLREKFMNEQIERYIKNRNGQIVVLSDLPIELMGIDGLPLIYTHDVCRIPETNYKVSMSIYAFHDKVSYTIPNDVIGKTLVILAAPNDENFFSSNAEIVKLCAESKIRCEYCTGKKEFKRLLEEIQPEFLIVDCHGNFDDTDLSSHLNINGEDLKHEDIQAINCIVPLVFLSACTTNPTYGYVHSIANAFLGKGSMCVTTTLLPVNITRATEFYARILRMLNDVAQLGHFPNWLSFMGHVTRTAPFMDIFKNASKKLNRLSTNKKKRSEKVINELEKIANRSYEFKNRRETFLRINELLNNIDEEIRIDFQKIVHEHLLYSHVGRADLIYFESWHKKKLDKINDLSKMMRRDETYH